jgi:hypothetical protein
VSSIAAAGIAPFVAAYLGVPSSVSAGLFAAAVTVPLGAGVALHLAARYVVGGLRR